MDSSLSRPPAEKKLVRITERQSAQLPGMNVGWKTRMRSAYRSAPFTPAQTSLYLSHIRLPLCVDDCSAVCARAIERETFFFFKRNCISMISVEVKHSLLQLVWSPWAIFPHMWNKIFGLGVLLASELEPHEENTKALDPEKDWITKW